MSFYISKKLEEKISISDIDSQLNDKKSTVSFEKIMSLKIKDLNFEVNLFDTNKNTTIELECPESLFCTLKKSKEDDEEAVFCVTNCEMFSFNTKDMIFKRFKKIDNFLLSIVILIHNEKLRCLWLKLKMKMNYWGY